MAETGGSLFKAQFGCKSDTVCKCHCRIPSKDTSKTFFLMLRLPNHHIPSLLNPPNHFYLESLSFLLFSYIVTN